MPAKHAHMPFRNPKHSFADSMNIPLHYLHNLSINTKPFNIINKTKYENLDEDDTTFTKSPDLSREPVEWNRSKICAIVVWHECDFWCKWFRSDQFFMPCLDAILKVCRQSNRLGENQAKVASLLKQNQKGYSIVSPNCTLFFIIEHYFWDRFARRIYADIWLTSNTFDIGEGPGHSLAWVLFLSIWND